MNVPKFMMVYNHLQLISKGFLSISSNFEDCVRKLTKNIPLFIIGEVQLYGSTSSLVNGHSVFLSFVFRVRKHGATSSVWFQSVQEPGGSDTWILFCRSIASWFRIKFIFEELPSIERLAQWESGFSFTPGAPQHSCLARWIRGTSTSRKNHSVTKSPQGDLLKPPSFCHQRKTDCLRIGGNEGSAWRRVPSFEWLVPGKCSWLSPGVWTPPGRG